MLLSSQWQINTSIAEPLWGFGKLWESEPELDLQLDLQLWPGLGLSLGLGLCPEEPETLGHEGRSMFPKLGVSSVGKSTELVTATLWDVGLDLLAFYKSLDRVSTCMHGLGIVGLHLH